MATYGGNSTIVEIIRDSTGPLGSSNGTINPGQIVYSLPSGVNFGFFYLVGYYGNVSGNVSNISINNQVQAINTATWHSWGGSISGSVFPYTANTETGIAYTASKLTYYSDGTYVGSSGIAGNFGITMDNKYNNTGIGPLMGIKMLPSNRIALSGTVPNGSTFRLTYYVEIHKNS